MQRGPTTTRGGVQAYDPAPAAAGYVMTDSNIRTAVDAWFSDATAAEATYGHISTWETSGVTDMFALFRNKGSFNEDISAWITSGVTDMSELFSGSSFNEDIGAWDTSGVETMRYMFFGASAFNQDIGNWAVHSVKNLYGMFFGASAFNQDIGAWDTWAHKRPHANRASAFDQDLGWCVDDDLGSRSTTLCEPTSRGHVRTSDRAFAHGQRHGRLENGAVAAWLSNPTAAEDVRALSRRGRLEGD